MGDTSIVLERASQDLMKLELAGIITPQERKHIFSTRSKHENSLARQRGSSERAFLAYSSYELALETTLRLRMRKSRHHALASTVQQHVRRVLGRAVRQNTSSLHLWYVFVQYCEKHGSNKLLSRVLAKALRYHTDSVGLWLYAATFEFQKNLNVNAARAILQRALRNCAEKGDIWLAYFKMEIMYANVIKSRKAALLSQSLTEATESSKGGIQLKVEDGAIAFLVFHKGASQQERDSNLCLRMLCAAMGLHHASTLIECMLASRIAYEQETATVANFILHKKRTRATYRSLHKLLSTRDVSAHMVNQLHALRRTLEESELGTSTWSKLSFLLKRVHYSVEEKALQMLNKALVLHSLGVDTRFSKRQGAHAMITCFNFEEHEFLQKGHFFSARMY